MENIGKITESDFLEIAVYRKLGLIQNEVKKIVRNEKNRYQNYFFFNELQVLELLKPLFEKYKIAFFFTDDSKEIFHFEQKGNNFLVKYLKKIDIIDIESEKIEISKGIFKYPTGSKISYNFGAIGANQDPAKAKGAAETYALKYVLTKLFLIPIRNNEDPDYYNEDYTSSKLNSKDEYEKSATDLLKKYDLS